MPKEMTQAQRAYEERRAAKAGLPLDRWLADKERQKVEAARAAEPPKPGKTRKPGLLSRLIDRAHKPL
jgi:capsid protein